MQLGALILGDGFEAVLHQASPVVAYGHLRSNGGRCAMAYRHMGREEAVIVACAADYSLKELLTHLEGKKGRPMRLVVRRTAASPATIAELRERIKELLAGGHPDE
jgi:hypothetical protein